MREQMTSSTGCKRERAGYSRNRRGTLSSPHCGRLSWLSSSQFSPSTLTHRHPRGYHS